MHAPAPDHGAGLVQQAKRRRSDVVHLEASCGRELHDLVFGGLVRVECQLNVGNKPFAHSPRYGVTGGRPASYVIVVGGRDEARQRSISCSITLRVSLRADLVLTF